MLCVVSGPARTSKGAGPPVLCLKPPLVPYIVRENSEVAGETVQMRKLAGAFAVHLCDKYPFHMGRLISR